MSGGGGQSTNSVVQQQGPPQQFLDAFQNINNRAQATANTPFSNYPGPMVADFTGPQNQAFSQIQGLQGITQPYLNAASQDFNMATQPLLNTIPTMPSSTLSGLGNGALSYIQSAAGPGVGDAGSSGAWQDTTAGYNGAQNIAGAAQGFTPGSVSQFNDPYTQQVVNATQQQFANQNAQQQQGLISNAISQGAFGGDRLGVAEGIMAGQQQLAQAPVIAGLEDKGYQTALGAAETQAAQRLQGATAAGQLGLQGQMAGSALNFQGAQSQAQAEQQAAQQMMAMLTGQQQTELGANEANAWLASQAGFGQANLGNEALNTGLTSANALEGVGALGQQQAQELLNIPYEQWLAQQSYPFQTTGFLANIAEGLGGASGGTSSTRFPAPSPISQIGGLATAGIGALGAANQAGAFGSGGLGGFFGSGVPSDAAVAAGEGLSNTALAADAGSAGAGTLSDLGFLNLVARGGRIPHRAPGGSVPGVDFSVDRTPIAAFNNPFFGPAFGLTPKLTVNGQPLLNFQNGINNPPPPAPPPMAAAPTPPTPMTPLEALGNGAGGGEGGAPGGGASGGNPGGSGVEVGTGTGLAGSTSSGLSGSLGGGFTGSSSASGPNLGGTFGGMFGGVAGGMLGGMAGPVGSLAGGFAGNKGGHALGNAIGNMMGLGNATNTSFGPADLANNAAVSNVGPGFASDLMGMGATGTGPMGAGSGGSGYGGYGGYGGAGSDMAGGLGGYGGASGAGSDMAGGLGGADMGGDYGGGDYGGGDTGGDAGGDDGGDSFARGGLARRGFYDGGDVGDTVFDAPDEVPSAPFASEPSGFAPASQIDAGGFGAPARASPWLPLMAAGFGMMAGRSPNALSNVGAGGMAGLREYQQEQQFAARAGQRQLATQLAQERIDSLRQGRADTAKYRQAEIDNMAARLHVSVEEASKRLAMESQRIGLEGARVGLEGGHLAESARHDREMEGLANRPDYTTAGVDAQGNAVLMDRRSGKAIVGPALAPKAPNAEADESLRLYLGSRDPITGKPGMSLDEARARVQGLHGSQEAPPVPSGPIMPPAGAVDLLKKHPEYAPQFISKYGADAYSKMLGSQGP